MLIEEIYNPRPRTILASKTIGEAVKSMFEQCCNGYIVVDERGHVLGVLSLQDIAAFLLPIEFRQNVNMSEAMYKKGLFIELCRDIKGKLVKDVMRKEIVTVDLKTNILTVLADFLQNDLYIIPVIEQDHLIGVLTRTEVRKAIVQGMMQPTNE